MSYQWWLFDADLKHCWTEFFFVMVDQVATNIFEKRDGKWLLCCHHASHTKRWIITQFEFQFVPTYIIASPHCHKISSERSEGTSEMSYKVRHQIFCFRYECINGSQIKPPWPKPRCYGQCWCTHGCCCASSLLWPCDILCVPPISRWTTFKWEVSTLKSGLVCSLHAEKTLPLQLTRVQCFLKPIMFHASIYWYYVNSGIQWVDLYLLHHLRSNTLCCLSTSFVHTD